MGPQPRRLPRASPLVHLLGKKWTIPVVDVLYDARGSMQFNAMLDSIGEITPKNLSACLKELVAAGLVSRKEITSIYYRNLKGTEYCLTERGARLHKFIMDTGALGVSLYS